VGCSGQVEPEPMLLEAVQGEGQETAILLSLPDSLIARVTSTDGAPLEGVLIAWEVIQGGGTLEPQGLSTDSDGIVRVEWTLGPVVGEQVVRASVSVGNSVDFSASGTPGAVIVAVWRNLDEETRSRMPTDTMRIHAVFPGTIEDAREALDAGNTFNVGGVVIRGPGIDPNWPFHLDPAHVSVAPAELSRQFECVEGPLITSEEVDAFLEDSLNGQYCPWHLYLVGVEEVPDWYITQLAGE
jgi:hypothetical protein